MLQDFGSMYKVGLLWRMRTRLTRLLMLLGSVHTKIVRSYGIRFGSWASGWMGAGKK